VVTYVRAWSSAPADVPPPSAVGDVPAWAFAAGDLPDSAAADGVDERDLGFVLPGWGSPPLEVEERVGRVQRARKGLLLAGLTLFLAGLIMAIIFAARLVGAGSPTTAAPVAPGPSGEPVAATSISGPVDGVTAAEFDVVDGARSVRIRAASLGADLYRVETPSGSDVAPRIDRAGGNLRLRLPHGSTGAPDEVDIVLNADVRWTLRIDGGADRKTVDLSAATVDRVDLAGGARTIDLTLPAPRGTLPVRMAGGVENFRVRLPGATPVRVRVRSGAGAVTLPGVTHHGIAPGRSFTANGWDSGRAGVDLLAEAGMATLTVSSD
jgi:hypothetical protein